MAASTGKRSKVNEAPGCEAMDVENSSSLEVDVVRNLYPYSITWSPIPGISCCLPCVGHMGLADSEGVIYDFAGPYCIGKGRMAFGDPTRYLQLDPQHVRGDSWDASLARATSEYSKRMHNIFLDNCHSMVARALNYAGYAGVKGNDDGRSGGYNMFWLGALVFVKGSYTGPSGVLKTWMPFVILVLVLLFCFRDALSGTGSAVRV
eukprot:TRINITY_DN48890_c0_g1_i1.p1 TRINITY_DN48890_c0_g1~~TRINITY_DN48890_c0_g1_i1.p1  ORF type:complete len:230 (+),score=32.63 TRINITY_DN48890_c0_g1_i1:74-691(+)